MKILIVEDDPMVAKLYKTKLEMEGFEVIEAGEGQDGLQKLSQNPHLILLDLMMPIMDGFEFLETIKKNQKYKNIPVIALTILGQDVDIQKAKRLGAVDYLVKTDLTPKQVVEKIREHLPNK
jgi:CheY-like chemotaxis protein